MTPFDPSTASTIDQLQPVTGDVLPATADTGSAPVKIGGRYSLVPPTLTDGQRGDLQIDPSGYMRVGVRTAATTGVDGNANAYNGFAGEGGTLLNLNVKPQFFNGTTWDRQRGNQENITAGITAVAVTTTQTGADQTNYNARGVMVVLDMTTVGTGSVTLEIDGKDPVSGKYYPLLTGAAVITVSTNLYTLYPSVAAVANAAVSNALPRTWRIKVTANNANATTYTVGCSLVL